MCKELHLDPIQLKCRILDDRNREELVQTITTDAKELMHDPTATMMAAIVTGHDHHVLLVMDKVKASS